MNRHETSKVSFKRLQKTARLSYFTVTKGCSCSNQIASCCWLENDAPPPLPPPPPEAAELV